ncbi:hypothetical protein O181_018782 [Austropuccinia psidii MF-1]|uniref:Uncharacterized protein n=1 Tax=Austropuccinia psidii MF-1 TaxID=1389203 RepID=A0A9Q3GTT9_9BASI|nr:hypothetical protein [Austropuccinia psidii MF-1]
MSPGCLLFFANTSLGLPRNPTLHMQILTLYMQIFTLVQVPNNSKNTLRRGSPPTIPTIPYANAGSQKFTCKTLGLYRLLTIQEIPYAGAGFQHFTHKTLCLYRFPTVQTVTHAGEASQ